MSNISFLEKYNKTRSKPFKQVNKETDTQWDYAIENGKLILRFDETRSPMDWWQNFRFLRKPYRDMKPKFRVHKGFIGKYKSIRSTLFGIIASSEYDRIEILGYSQGGALALLAHEDIWYHRPELRNNKLITIVFGCPRVVSWFAPKDRWHNVIRIQNGNDIVSKVPFSFLGYKHVGVPVTIGPERKWWKLSINDHFPKSYRESME